MKKMMEFIARLDSEKLSYTLKRTPYGEGVTVLVDAHCEWWEVSFWLGGEVETVVYDGRPPEPNPESALDGLFDRCSKTWQRAAQDLGVELVTPFTFVGKDGSSYSCAGLLEWFGGQKGTLIVSHKDDYEVSDAGYAVGYCISALSPLWYYRYDRARFIETLSDWGWFGGDENRPSWSLEG